MKNDHMQIPAANIERLPGEFIHSHVAFLEILSPPEKRKRPIGFRIREARAPYSARRRNQT